MKNMNFIKAIVVCSFMLLSGIVLAQTGMKDIKVRFVTKAVSQ